MGLKNAYHNEYVKQVQAGSFKGTFEDWMSENYGAQWSEGGMVKEETKNTTLGGSYQNWTQVAQAYHGGRLDPVQETKYALALQAANPGVNTWSPGQTINLPPIRAAMGTISDAEWAQQLDREYAMANQQGGERPYGRYFDWESGQPTRAYWADQTVTRGGYERGEAFKQMATAPGATTAETLSKQVWDTFFRSAEITPTNAMLGLPEGVSAPARIAASGLGPLSEILSGTFAEAPKFPLNGKEVTFQDMIGIDPKGAMDFWLAANPDAAARLDVDDTSGFTDEQMALFVQLGIYDNPIVNDPSTSAESPGGMSYINPYFPGSHIPKYFSNNSYRMPVNMNMSRSMWTLINWRA